MSLSVKSPFPLLAGPLPIPTLLLPPLFFPLDFFECLAASFFAFSCAATTALPLVGVQFQPQVLRALCALFPRGERTILLGTYT